MTVVAAILPFRPCGRGGVVPNAGAFSVSNGRSPAVPARAEPYPPVAALPPAARLRIMTGWPPDRVPLHLRALVGALHGI